MKFLLSCIVGCVMAVSIFACPGTALSDAQPNPALASDWAAAHGGPSMQAATARSGPLGAQGRGAIARSGAGVRGVARWRGQTAGGALYGASLSHVFRYRTDGPMRFDAGFALTRFGSISWNLFALSSVSGPDRIVVPQPLGLRNPAQRRHPCAGRVPSLLVFEDRPGQPLDCTGKFEFDEARLSELCAVPRGYRLGYSGTLTGVLFSGEVAAIVGFKSPTRSLGYMVVIDNDLSFALSCAEIGPSASTNMFPVERLANGGSAAYVAIENALVRLDYDPRTRQMVRRWSVDLGMPQRTGTTPTLVGFGADRFVVLVDGVCAVANVFTGRIRCSDRDTSRMVHVRRSETVPTVEAVDLPPGIRTIENSPAAAGLQVVIANYGGYDIDPAARGVVAVSWDAGRGGWKTDWYNPAVQMNGVPTLSTATGVVYGSGSTSKRAIGMTGLVLAGPNGGKPAFLADIGEGGDFLDRGVNTVILPGQRLVYGVAEGLVVVGR